MRQAIADVFSGAHVLITGGVGFIGSHIGRRLAAAGAAVTLVDSLIPECGGNLANIKDFEQGVRFNIADVRDSRSMEPFIERADFLFNLAGQTSHLDSMRDPFPDLEINARAQLSILEACRKHNHQVRIVFASTRQIYGRPRYLPVDENHPIVPIDVNGVNKAAGENYHLVYHTAHGLRTSVLRLTNTYGPAMRVKDARQTFVGIWVKNILTGVPITIFGDGAQVRDLAYVDDVVDAFLQSALTEQAIGTALNIGGSERISLRDLAELLVRCNGSGSVETVPFPDELKAIDIGDYYSDDSAARTLLEWAPRVTLEDGLRRTLDYYRAHGEEYFR
ncbi:MAG: NAD-dependent epimerase/dehydratase family protein [Gaiellaceae bacterium]|jgi:UDP-glucose 4-epimerase